MDTRKEMFSFNPATSEPNACSEIVRFYATAHITNATLLESINRTIQSLNSTEYMRVILEQSDRYTDCLYNEFMKRANASQNNFLNMPTQLSPQTRIFYFLYFLVATNVRHILMNSFSVFYMDELEKKIAAAYGLHIDSVFSFKNKTEIISNPCQTYISYIWSSTSGIFRNLKYYINPTLATLGLWQNILCIVVLKKDGFSKTSNLNLLSVIVAGSFQQLLSLNIAEILELDSGVDMYELVSAFTCVKKKNLALQLFKHIFLFLGTWGQYVFSSTFLLITIERFLAVFLPLQFKKYVTRKSIVSCLCIIFLMWLPFTLYKILCIYKLEISLTIFPAQVDLFWLNSCYTNSMIFAITVLVVSKLIPLFLVLLGSVVIAFRIKILLNKRSKLTSLPHKLSWSNQTTKVLLATCLLFSISDVLQYILSYVAVHFIKILDIGFLIHSEFICFSYLLTSCNTFLIFISTNKRLVRHCKKFIRSVRKIPETVTSFT